MKHFVINLVFDRTECILKHGPLADDGRLIVEDPREIEQLGGDKEAVLVNEVSHGRFSLQKSRRKLHDLMMAGAVLVVSPRVKAILNGYLPDGETDLLPVSIFDPKGIKKLAEYYWVHTRKVRWELPFPPSVIFQYGGGEVLEWVGKEELVNKITRSGATGFRFLETEGKPNEGRGLFG